MIGFFLAMVLVAGMQPRVTDGDRPVDTGVSQALALERVSTIRELRYDLTFSIPTARTDPVRGRVVVSLTLKTPSRVVLDFAQPRQNVRSVVVNGAQTS